MGPGWGTGQGWAGSSLPCLACGGCRLWGVAGWALSLLPCGSPQAWPSLWVLALEVVSVCVVIGVHGCCLVGCVSFLGGGGHSAVPPSVVEESPGAPGR